MKKVLITGITGQDGSYLAELLLDKGYEVWGVKRRSSSFNTARINHIFDKIQLLYGDLTDSSIVSIIQDVMPDEIYNLAAQSHVKVSFDIPEYTVNSIALGTLRILETIRSIKDKQIKMYQASSSEMFGSSLPPQNENTLFNPQSPYACAKVFSYNLTRNYRKAYNVFVSNGILFNHESPRRGETFVTKKITRGLARVAAGLEDKITLGNLDAKRDWGHSKDYCEAMYLMLQQDTPDDFVVATGESHSVREFLIKCLEWIGTDYEFVGTGLQEKVVDKKTGQVIVDIDEKFFRPSEVNYLCGDSSKARKLLGWNPKVTFDELVSSMMEEDFKNV